MRIESYLHFNGYIVPLMLQTLFSPFFHFFFIFLFTPSFFFLHLFQIRDEIKTVWDRDFPSFLFLPQFPSFFPFPFFTPSFLYPFLSINVRLKIPKMVPRIDFWMVGPRDLNLACIYLSSRNNMGWVPLNHTSSSRCISGKMLKNYTLGQTLRHDEQGLIGPYLLLLACHCILQQQVNLKEALYIAPTFYWVWATQKCFNIKNIRIFAIFT